MLICGLIGVGCEDNQKIAQLQNENAELKRQINRAMMIEPEYQRESKENRGLMEFMERTLTLVNEINESLAKINVQEDQIEQLNREYELAPEADTYSLKKKIFGNISDIENILASNAQKIDSLDSIIVQSEFKINSLVLAVATLKSTIAQKDAEIDSLKFEASTLKRRVESLQGKVYEGLETLIETKENLERTKKELDDQMRQNEELSTKYYFINTEATLLDLGIIQKIKKNLEVKSIFETKYFKPLKMQDDQIIELGDNSSNYQLISRHSHNSFKIYSEYGKKYLKILNASEFWHVTNYLIITTSRMSQNQKEKNYWSPNLLNQPD